MIPLSLRLPEDLAFRLDREADLEGKMRSEIVRQAIDHYISFLERERFLTKMVEAARSLAEDREARAESKELSENLVDEGLDSLIAAEHEDGTDSGLTWWK